MSVTRVEGMFRSAEEIAADIARELREHPEHWIQHSLVRLESGVEEDEPEYATRSDAICWCLEGLIVRRTKWSPEDGSVDREQVFDTFRTALGETDLYRWNDAHGRTVGDVIALAERVANRTDEDRSQT